MNKKLRGFTCLCAVLAAPFLYAVPARKVVKSVTQPDGSELQIRLCGDEYLRYYETLDGVPVKESGNGFYYATLSSDTLAVYADMLAHDADLRTPEESQKADSLKQVQSDHPQGTHPGHFPRFWRAGAGSTDGRQEERSGHSGEFQGCEDADRESA